MTAADPRDAILPAEMTNDGRRLPTGPIPAPATPPRRSHPLKTIPAQNPPGHTTRVATVRRPAPPPKNNSAD